jgi:hypothetical protein
VNPFVWTLTCDICGGEGGATSSANRAAWRGATITHRDPDVCRANLAHAARQRERMIDPAGRKIDRAAARTDA